MSNEQRFLQPASYRGGGQPKGVPQYKMGANRSIAKLKELNFDPITSLVVIYNEIVNEILRQEDIREGKIVELTSTGKVRAYNADRHHNLFDKLISISKELVRYGYGRVPETLNLETKKPAPLIIQTTKENSTYVISGFEEEQPDYIEEME